MTNISGVSPEEETQKHRAMMRQDVIDERLESRTHTCICLRPVDAVFTFGPREEPHVLRNDPTPRQLSKYEVVLFECGRLRWR